MKCKNPTSNLTYSLTVDGISGVKIYNKIEVDTRFLPVNYGNTLNFIVTGVSHKLNNNDWETQIETTVMPKTEVLSIQSTVSSSAYVGGGGGVSDEQTLTSGWPMKSIQYSKATTVKSQIYLHHDAFYQRSDKGKGCASILFDKGVSCHAMIDIDGHIEYMFDDKYISYCQGLVQPAVPGQIWPNATGLSVEIAGLGYEGRAVDYSIGEPLVNCVDWNGNTIAEYKSHKKYQEYSDAQIVALKGLLKRWVAKHNIPFKWEGKKTYKLMFPKKGTNSPEVAKGKPGIWTHNSVDKDKSDVFPSPKLIKMLKQLSIELNP